MTLKVIQLTDTHLFKDPGRTQKGVNTYQTLGAVVADVAARHADLDALLLTGDLSQDETPESYDILLEMLAPILGTPAYAVPGNHDNLDHMRARLRGIAVLEDAVLDSWRIVMLNSRVPGQVGGEIGEDQRRRMRSIVRDAGARVMIAVHHPPLPIHSAWLDALGCADGQALLDEIADPPVKAVICGHVHQVFETTFQGIAVLTTPSTCVQFKPGAEEFAIDDAPPGYRILELYDDGGWSTQVRRVERVSA